MVSLATFLSHNIYFLVMHIHISSHSVFSIIYVSEARDVLAHKFSQRKYHKGSRANRTSHQTSIGHARTVCLPHSNYRTVGLALAASATNPPQVRTKTQAIPHTPLFHPFPFFLVHSRRIFTPSFGIYNLIFVAYSSPSPHHHFATSLVPPLLPQVSQSSPTPALSRCNDPRIFINSNPRIKRHDPMFLRLPLMSLLHVLWSSPAPP
jgi:hypothetical protein